MKCGEYSGRLQTIKKIMAQKDYCHQRKRSHDNAVLLATLLRRCFRIPLPHLLGESLEDLLDVPVLLSGCLVERDLPGRRKLLYRLTRHLALIILSVVNECVLNDGDGCSPDPSSYLR